MLRGEGQFTGIALRAFVADSCNSLSTRGGEEMWEKLEGGLMPERFMMPCK
jgi:hypothetical protein